MLPVDLFVLHTLVLDIAFDDVFVGVLTDGVHVEAARPEVSSPEELFDCGMMRKDMLGCEAFYDLNNA